MRRAAIIAWIGLAIAVVVWVNLVFGQGVTWQDDSEAKVPAGQTWLADSLKLSLTTLDVAPAILDGDGNQVSVMPGASLVKVVLDYSLDGQVANRTCALSLIGHNRQWYPQPDLSATAAADDNATTDCATPGGNSAMVAVFLIPSSALTEIAGVRVFVIGIGADFWNPVNNPNVPTWQALLAPPV